MKGHIGGRLGPVLLLCLAGCGLVGREDADGLRVGVIVDRSGPAQYIGEAEAQVLRAMMAAYEAQGIETHGLRLDIRDSEGDPVTAQALFNAFAFARDVVAVIGPSTSGEAIPLSVKAAHEGVPLLSLAASGQAVVREDGSVNPWAFKFAQGEDLAAQRLVEAMRAQRIRTLGLLFSDDGFGRGGSTAFRAAARGQGIRIEHSAAFPAGPMDPWPVIEELPEGLDAVLIWGTAPGPRSLLDALRGIQYPGEVFLSHGNAAPAFIAESGASSEGVWVVGARVLLPADSLDAAVPADRVVLDYQAFWNARVGGDPSPFGGHAWDALEALRAVLSPEVVQAGTAERRRLVRDRLEGLAPFVGVTGTFHFSADDHAGLSPDAFVLYRIQGGRFVPAVP